MSKQLNIVIAFSSFKRLGCKDKFKIIKKLFFLYFIHDQSYQIIHKALYWYKK